MILLQQIKFIKFDLEIGVEELTEIKWKVSLFCRKPIHDFLLDGNIK